jgi:hypothetical protein
VDYVGNEYVICSTPLEIAIPREYVKKFVQSMNENELYNIELRNKWETKHVLISRRSIINNAPTLGSVIRSILRIKTPYCSMVSNGLRMKFNMGGGNGNPAGGFCREGKKQKSHLINIFHHFLQQM